MGGASIIRIGACAPHLLNPPLRKTILTNVLSDSTTSAKHHIKTTPSPTTPPPPEYWVPQYWVVFTEYFFQRSVSRVNVFLVESSADFFFSFGPKETVESNNGRVISIEHIISAVDPSHMWTIYAVWWTIKLHIQSQVVVLSFFSWI